MIDPMLRFEDITFGYRAGVAPALEHVSLAISKGTITALLGPNGAGKSTLLMIALGWLTPKSGRVRLEGHPLGSFSRREMGRQMGLVPQLEHMPFEYSALDYVLLGRAPYLAPLEQPAERDYAVALEALKRVGMSEFAFRSVVRMSGGERQMLLIARTLAQEPGLILLDEPTAHIDLHNKSRLVGLLRGLTEQGVTVLMTTHEPELASAVASHVVLMSHGKILFSGPSADALTSDHLSNLYQSPVQVIEASGRRLVLW